MGGHDVRVALPPSCVQRPKIVYIQCVRGRSDLALQGRGHGPESPRRHSEVPGHN